MPDEPSFEIPSRPERRYPPTGGVEYAGRTVFVLTPASARSMESLDDLLDAVLADDRYVRGDFFDLPAPAYLVRDAAIGSSFRVVVRDGHLEFHVLPHTDSDALAALFDRLVAEGAVDFSVECRSEPAAGGG